MRTEKYGMFIQLFIINFLITFAFSVNDSLFSLYMGDINMNAAAMGAAFAFYSLSKIILSPFSGKMLDKFGFYKILNAGLLAYLAVSCSYFFFIDQTVILITRIIQGGACALFRPVIHYSIGINSRKETQGKTLSIFDMSFYTALAAAPFFGGVLRNAYGHSSVFLLMSAVSFAALVIGVLSGSKAIKGKIHSTARCGVSLAHCTPLLFYIFWRGWCISSVVVLLPVYLKKTGFSDITAGLIISISSLFFAVSLPLAGVLADKKDRKRLIGSGGILSALLLIVLVQTAEFSVIAFLAAAYGISGAVSQSACSTELIRSTRSEYLGSLLGRFHCILGSGAACGAFFSSVLSSQYSAAKTVAPACVLSICASVYVFYSGIKHEKKQFIQKAIKAQACE